VKHEPLNDRFLETLRKNSPKWETDKDLAKIVKKMQKGKNLSKKEFSKLHWLLRDIGQVGHLNLS
jgi:hypothetical protein